MNKSFIILCAIIFGFAAAKVQDLDPSNFDSIVDGSKPAFVEFYAPWCGHCKRLEPEFAKVGDAFGKLDVVIAKVDASEHKDLGNRFGVRGYPTLKWFPKGVTEPEDYNGGREADDIIKFINEKAGTNARLTTVPTVSDVTVLTPQNFDSVVGHDKFALVEFYAPWCGHCKSLAPTWEKLATIFKNEESVVIANVNADTHKDLAEKYDIRGFPTIKWFQRDSKDGEKYESGRDIADLVKFVNEKAGTKRTVDGRLDSTYGRLDAFDTLATQFMSDGPARETILADAEKAMADLVGSKAADHAGFYVKVMKAILKKGDQFVDKETARLKKMVDSTSVNAKKVDEFTVRLNILAAFKN